jgi:hypothetical protein
MKGGIMRESLGRLQLFLLVVLVVVLPMLLTACGKHGHGGSWG